MSYAVEEIAQNLKAARLRKGLSQRELSKLAGVPQSHISKIENETVDLRISSLAAIANALDMEIKLIHRSAGNAVEAINGRMVRATNGESKQNQKVDTKPNRPKFEPRPTQFEEPKSDSITYLNEANPPRGFKLKTGAIIHTQETEIQRLTKTAIRNFIDDVPMRDDPQDRPNKQSKLKSRNKQDQEDG